MSGATARVFTLLSTTTTTAPTLLRRHISSPFLLFRRRNTAVSSVVFLSNLHTHSHSPRVDSFTAATPLPWPEWSHFVSRVSAASAVVDRQNEVNSDEFAASTQLTDAFINDVTAFLAFARQHPSLFWCLPREDIEVIIQNISPKLFMDTATTTSRMRSFLAGGANHLPESDGPSTVDLMKYLLSYVHMAFVSSEEMRISDKVEASAKKLFSELVRLSGTSSKSIASSVQTRFPEGYGLGPNSSVNHIEMKRGDWICTRCNFMNFAKNKQCLQCEELRPKKLLTGGEWECPQCDFFNFGRNVVCLRCDCKKPRVNPPQTPANYSSVESNTEKPLPESKDKQQPWLSKITQLEKASDLSTSISEEDFSKFMQAGNNNKVSSSSSNSAINENSDGININQSGADSNINVNIKQNLGELLAPKSSVSPSISNDGDSAESRKDASPFYQDLPEILPMQAGEPRFVVSKKKDRSLTSPTYKRQVAMEQAGSSKHVPFVPFPPNYFAQNKADSTAASSKPEASGDTRSAMQNNTDTTAVSNQQIGQRNSDLGKTGEQNERKPTTSYEAGEKSRVEDVSWRGRSLEGSAVTEPDPLDMSEEAKALRWFRRVAQIKDISELSQIPDEDFPSIIPLRKGVNRFVVSKRKTPLERRLTSSQYTRNLPVANSEPDKDTKATESS
ncbi:zinc finger protein VAR3, chloroplastic [Silene latifolia]|uniref:zinc finger protein VAR3, chloroplastic n=1 Tax=Silene latifolia TaxID=37657 RepID=UPI003D76E5D3